MVTTNLVTTMERQWGQMRDFHCSSPQAWPLEAKELGQNEQPSPPSTDTQWPMPTTNPRSKNGILLPSNSWKQTTMAEEQWCVVTTPNAQAILEQWQQWEHLCKFHASITLWSVDIPMQGIEGDLPLIWMMLYPLSKEFDLCLEQTLGCYIRNWWSTQPCDRETTLPVSEQVEFQDRL